MAESDADDAIVADWIAYTARSNPEGGDLNNPGARAQAFAVKADWATQRLMRLQLGDAPRALRIAFRIARESDDKWVLCNLGAGPLESILADGGPEALRLTKDEMATSPNLVRALRNTWQNSMPDAIWSELQRSLARSVH
jgi:hypothetical protein